MIVIDKGHLILKDWLAFFPTLKEMEDLNQRLRFNTILRIRHASIKIDEVPNLIRSEIITTHCINLEENLKSIYAGMHPRSCRYRISKAEQMKDMIRIDVNNIRVYNDFIDIYNTLARQKGHTYPISRKYLQEYLTVSDVWVIYCDDRPICGHLIVLDGAVNRAHLCYSASLHLNSKEDAQLSGALNRYLHWHEIQAYKNRGFQLYDFGAGGGASLRKFKSSFGGVEVPEYNYVLTGKFGTATYQFYKQLVRARLYLRI